MIKNLFKRIYCIFSPSKNDFKVIRDDLKTLHNLFHLVSSTNKLEALVELFQVAIPIKEKGVIKKAIKNLKRKNYSQINQVINALEKIEEHLEKIQTSVYNQTMYGKIPNDETIFLVNNFSIKIESVKSLSQKRTLLEKENLGYQISNHKEIKSKWDYLVKYQAEAFTKLHVNSIENQISILKVAKFL